MRTKKLVFFDTTEATPNEGDLLLVEYHEGFFDTSYYVHALVPGMQPMVKSKDSMGYQLYTCIKSFAVLRKLTEVDVTAFNYL